MQKYFARPYNDIKDLSGRAKYFWIVFTIKFKRNNQVRNIKKYNGNDEWKRLIVCQSN
jgi:hypothetical protein